MQDDENSSSTKVAITFVGFQEKLVIPFIQKVSAHNISEFIMVSSTAKPEGENREVNKQITRSAHELILKLFHDIRVTEIELKNIWDYYEHLKLISQFDGNELYVNVSAGPSTFTSAMSLYSVVKGHHIFYSVETFDDGSFFVETDLKPLRFYFSLDPLDRMILESVKRGKKTRKELFIEISRRGEITSRSVSYRVEALTIKGLLLRSGRKTFEYELAQSLKFLI